MDFRLLGPVEVHDAGVIALGGRRQRAVLAALALRANEAVSTDYLVDAVWEKPPASPGSNIRTLVLGLRRRLDGGRGSRVGPDTAGRTGRLLTRAPGYLLWTRRGEVDVEVFNALAERGGRDLERGCHAEALRCLQDALALWRGQPLEGLTPGPALQAAAAWLAERRLAVAGQHVQALLRLGRYGDAIGELRRLVVEYPFHESLWAELIRALCRGGRESEGLDAYRQARQALADELGMEPGEELQRLHLAILNRDPSLRPTAADPIAVAYAQPDAAATLGGAALSAAIPGGPAGARPAAPAGFPNLVVRTLPMDIAEFTGRHAELSRLRELATGADGTPTAPVVCAIVGMPGVGKSRLAVRAAHEIAELGRYDEIQLYADLQGGMNGRAPAAVLESFLRLSGLPGDRLPGEPDDLAGLYRAWVYGRRALVVLDNAASEDQVRPLLPGSPDSCVLITSRHSLSGLDGVHLLPVEPFPMEDAVALLTRVVGRDRVRAEPQAAVRIAELCGRLPVAVATAARRLRARPAGRLADLAARLAAADQRLSLLTAGSRAVGDTFDLSYYALPTGQRRMFRLLALHPGADVTAHSAAALADCGPTRAEQLLEALLDRYLLQQVTPGRYRLHPLLRMYARQRAEAEETEADRRAAVARVLGWYRQTARAGRRAAGPQAGRAATDPTDAPGRPLPFAGHAQALAWFEAERANLAAVTAVASADSLR